MNSKLKNKCNSFMLQEIKFSVNHDSHYYHFEYFSLFIIISIMNLSQ